MRIATPTALWNTAANSPSRIVKWSFFARQVTDISLALTDLSVPWVNITEYVRSMPGAHQALEFQIGDFTADSIELTVDNIAWWKANILSTSPGDYIELMIQLNIGIDDAVMASDNCYVWCGFIEQSGTDGPQATESADELKIKAFTADELGNRLPANGMNVAAVSGGYLRLNSIGVDIVDTSALGAGIHTITYDYGSGTPTLKLDNGFVMPVVPGITYELDNATDPLNVTQSVQAKLRDVIILVTPRTESFVLSSFGGPAKKLVDAGMLKDILPQLYALEGINSCTLDTLTLASYDGTNRVSFIETPSDKVNLENIPCQAITDDGSGNLYLAIGSKIYKRTTATGAYTLIATGTGVFLRLWYNARNNHLWVLVGDGTNSDYGTSVQQYDLTGSAWLTATSLRVACYSAACDLIDFQYTSGSWTYGLVVADISGYVDIYSPNNTGSVLIWSPAALSGFVWRGEWDSGTSYVTNDVVAYAGFAFRATGTVALGETPPGTNWEYCDYGATSLFLAASSTAGKIVFTVDYNISTARSGISIFNRQYLDTSGNWHQDSASAVGSRMTISVAHVIPGSTAYSFNNDLIYFFDYTDKKVYNCSWTAATAGGLAYTDFSGFQVLSGNVYESLQSDKGWLVYEESTGGRTRSNLVDSLLNMQIGRGGSRLASAGGILFGVDYKGRLWKSDSTAEMFLVDFDYGAATVHDAIDKTLKAYMLIGKISSTKAVSVFKRIDASGNLITSGKSISISVNNDADIVETKKYIKACSLVSITAGSVTHTYNGTEFDTGQNPGDVIFSLSSEFLPPNLVQDLAYNFWKFCSADHDILSLPVQSANCEAEIFDGADVTFATTKIQKTATGIIMDQTINADASQEVKVLF